MKVKLQTTRTSVDGEGRTLQHNPGDIIDVSAEEAKRLIESEQAEPVARKKADRAERR